MTSDPTTDRIARDAARLIAGGEAATVPEAIGHALRAAGACGVDQRAGGHRPSVQLVRRHLRAMTMQAVGAEGYEANVRAMFEVAEEIMTALEDFDPHLLGRAAQGKIDGGATLYLRIFTRDTIGMIAERLVDFGYEEPTFETADSKRFGRFDRIRFEESGWPVVITRVLPDRNDLVAVDLFTGEKIMSLGLEQVRGRVGASDEPRP